MNKAFRDLLLGRISAALTNSNALAGVSHAGLKGQLRETIVRDLVRPFLPLRIGVGQGQIVSHDGQISSQIDVILYDPGIVPPVIFDGKDGLFPLESVLATIEVKSVRNATALREAHEFAERLSRLPYLPGFRNPYTGETRHHLVEHIIPTVLALSTDLSANGKSELDRMRELGFLSYSGLRGICVVGRGCWMAVGADWYPFPHAPQYAEVASFFSALTGALQRVAASRLFPQLDNYLFDQSEMPMPGRDAIPGN